MTAQSGLNADFLDLLRALTERGVEFVVVGAHAMAANGVPRATGDLDVLVRPERFNAERLLAALHDFGAPTADHGVTAADFERLGTVYQIGLPPRRIDLLTAISGVDFDRAWASRVAVQVEDMSVPFLGIEALIDNKVAAGRAKDLADVELLRRR